METITRKNLLFASVGERSVHQKFWLREKEKKNFDLALYYYGDEKNKYKNDAEFYIQRKGSKLQNLSHFYWNHKKEVSEYDAIFILDDDIQISTDAINETFEILHKYELWLCQPAYSKESFTDWPIIKSKKGNILRYTNFVEVSAMMFSQYAFQKCLSVFFDSITGYGVDVMLAFLLGYPKDKIAIIDSVECSHPFRRDSEMGKYVPRELHSLENCGLRKKYNAPKAFSACEYGSITNEYSP